MAGIPSFLKISSIPAHVHTTFSLTTLLSMDIWVASLSWPLWIMLWGNVGVQVSLWDPHFKSFGFIFTGGIAGSYTNSTSNFLRNFHTVSKMASPFYIPTTNAQRIATSLLPHQHLLFSLLLTMAILMDVRWYLTVVPICIYLITSDVLHFFHVLTGGISSLKKCLLKSLALILIKIFCCYKSLLHILNVHTLMDIWFAIFFLFH